jgi:hypothetical protein
LKCQGRGNVLKELLPHPSPSVLCLFELAYPIVDAEVQLHERFFLFK